MAAQVGKNGEEDTWLQSQWTEYKSWDILLQFYKTLKAPYFSYWILFAVGQQFLGSLDHLNYLQLSAVMYQIPGNLICRSMDRLNQTLWSAWTDYCTIILVDIMYSECLS